MKLNCLIKTCKIVLNIDSEKVFIRTILSNSLQYPNVQTHSAIILDSSRLAILANLTLLSNYKNHGIDYVMLSA